MVKESGGRTEAITPVRASWREVVITGPFINFLLHNHFITFFFKKKSGDVNYEANFSFFLFCFTRELNRYSPLTYSLPSARVEPLAQ